MGSRAYLYESFPKQTKNVVLIPGDSGLELAATRRQDRQTTLLQAHTQCVEMAILLLKELFGKRGAEILLGADMMACS